MFSCIAIAGKKASGKDLLVEHLLATRSNVEVIRCKTPVVQAYEKIVGHPYEKQRDDAALIIISRDIIRAENDNISAEYLEQEIPRAYHEGKLIVVPDMRRIPEWVALRSMSAMLVKVEASDERRMERLTRRDGSLLNYDPTDSTEVDVDHIQCTYHIDNDRDDGGAWAIQQLENYLLRGGKRFAAREETQV